MLLDVRLRCVGVGLPVNRDRWSGRGRLGTTPETLAGMMEEHPTHPQREKEKEKVAPPPGYIALHATPPPRGKPKKRLQEHKGAKTAGY